VVVSHRYGELRLDAQTKSDLLARSPGTADRLFYQSAF